MKKSMALILISLAALLLVSCDGLDITYGFPLDPDDSIDWLIRSYYQDEDRDNYDSWWTDWWSAWNEMENDYSDFSDGTIATSEALLAAFQSISLPSGYSNSFTSTETSGSEIYYDMQDYLNDIRYSVKYWEELDLVLSLNNRTSRAFGNLTITLKLTFYDDSTDNVTVSLDSLDSHQLILYKNFNDVDTDSSSVSNYYVRYVSIQSIAASSTD